MTYAVKEIFLTLQGEGVQAGSRAVFLRFAGCNLWSAREIKYMLNNQGQLEIPFSLTGKMPNVKAKPDANYLGQLVQRGFLRRGTDDLQNRFLGREKDRTEPSTEDSAGLDRKKKRSSEDLIRRGLEQLFRR